MKGRETLTDFLLALVPQYGLYIVSIVVFLAALGIPLPSSIVVLTSGGLAATGDLVLAQLLATTLLAYVVGDQIAYYLGRIAGPSWLEKLRSKKHIAPAVQRSETLYRKHGVMAILLSRTVFSPCGPCIAYLSGISRMQPALFFMTAFIGAILWTLIYTTLGFAFAGQVPEMSKLVTALLLVSIALFVTICFAIWLAFAWWRFQEN